MLNSALRHQSLARSLTDSEADFAAALEIVFAAGAHDPSSAAAALQSRGIARPSGSPTPWDADGLQAELLALNAVLDDAYSQNGIGA